MEERLHKITGIMITRHQIVGQCFEIQFLTDIAGRDDVLDLN